MKNITHPTPQLRDRNRPIRLPEHEDSAIHGSTIWGAEGAPGSGSLTTCSDGGAALRAQISAEADLRDEDQAGLDQSAEARQSENGDDATNTLAELDLELRRQSLKPFGGPQFYIPISRLHSVITPGTIKTALSCIGDTTSPDYERMVAKSFRKILAILILIGKEDSIFDFVDAGIGDAQLPLDKVEDGRPFQLSLSGQDQPIALFKTWENRHIEEFESKQWETLAPFFLRGAKHESLNYKLSWRHPLPFDIIPEAICNRNSTSTSISGSSSDGDSGNSKVWKVKIHRAHHDLPSYRVRHPFWLLNPGTTLADYKFQGNEDNPALAVKRLWATDRKTFENEVNILTRLNKCDDPHLVKLLLTMEISGRPGKGNSFFLLFPLADSNLRQFWQRSLPDSDRISRAAYSRWVAKQLYGLAWALCKLHDLHQREIHEPGAHGSLKANEDDTKSSAEDPFYGIHGDIKPENLLWYKDWVGLEDHKEVSENREPLGVLQLADFGISKLHHTETRSNATMRRSTKTYAAPEAEWGVDGCSRSFDIWSLGCVFLEFICWLVQGQSGTPDPVDSFHQARYLGNANRSLEGTVQDTFYQALGVRNGTRFKVNPAVTKVGDPTRIWSSSRRKILTLKL